MYFQFPPFLLKKNPREGNWVGKKATCSNSALLRPPLLELHRINSVAWTMSIDLVCTVQVHRPYTALSRANEKQFSFGRWKQNLHCLWRFWMKVQPHIVLIANKDEDICFVSIAPSYNRMTLYYRNFNLLLLILQKKVVTCLRCTLFCEIKGLFFRCTTGKKVNTVFP